MKRISFTTAKLAKEAGFNISFESPPLAYTDAGHLLSFGYYQPNNVDFIFAAPFQAELQSWLRNEHKLNVIVDFYDNSKYYGYESVVYDSKNREFHDEDMTDQAKPHHIDGAFDTYEDALEEGLLQALKIVIDEK